MYSNKPINYIESVKDNGFYLSNNYLITSPDLKGNKIGLLLIHSETFEIELNEENQSVNIENDWYVTFNNELLKIFELIHPKPEILVIGLGKKSNVKY